MNLPSELLNALPDEQAKAEAPEQVLHRLQRLDLDAYQVEYLNAWQRFYADHRHYLFPDDRAAPEYASPRWEDVSTLSYERTTEAVKQTRQDVLQSNKERLDSVLFTATSPTTRQHKLAHECHDTAARLNQYEADVFADLTAAIYAPCLPAPGFQPERRVDDPATVGAALGLLDFLIYAHAQFWATQPKVVSLTEAAPNQSPTTVRLVNTPALIVPDPTTTITAPPPYTLPPPTANELPIDKALSISRPILDQLLLNATMIEPVAEPGRFRALPQVKPWQWANVRAALREKLLIVEISDADAAALFKETYGAEVGRTTMQHNPQAELGNKRKTRRVLAYTTLLSNLETLIPPVKPGF